jgi:pimeloyl-ACP methyl ester carboxylesterase
MAKLETTKGYSRNGIPYICFGNRPRKLLIFSGGPGNEIPSGLMLQMMVSNYKCFANHYSVYILTRKLNQPYGYSTRDMSDDYATMVREELGGPVDILGTSLGGLIAQHFAADHLDLVRRLVIGVAAYRVSDEGKELDSLVAKLQSQGSWSKAYAKEMSGVYRRGLKKYLFQYFILLFGIFKRGTPAYPSDFLIEAEAEVNHNSK